jgi:hypothetical protein
VCHKKNGNRWEKRLRTTDIHSNYTRVVELGNARGIEVVISRVHVYKCPIISDGDVMGWEKLIGWEPPACSQQFDCYLNIY